MLKLSIYSNRLKLFFLLALIHSGIARAQTWTGADPVPLQRHSSAAVLLQDGRVFKTGGYMPGGGCVNAATNQCEIFDPSTNLWSVASPMNSFRFQHTATLLENGEILVTGGFCGGAAAEIYNPLTDSWSPAASMSAPRRRHTATLLIDGRVLIIGGVSNAPSTSCEIYDPVSNTWTPAAPMNQARIWQTANILPNGKVFVNGGVPNVASTPRTEIYDPGTNSWMIATPDPIARVAHGAILLPNGKILVTGGGVPATVTTTPVCALYDYLNDSWALTGSMNVSRDQFAEVLLPNGTVLVGGGDTTPTCEIYDPLTSSWTSTTAISVTANQLTFVLLADGRVLSAPGYISPIAEIYDYKVGSWSIYGNMTDTRCEYNLTHLPTGNILISGGAPVLPLAGFPLSTCQLYNHSTGSWSPTAAMTTPRAHHASVLLPDGKVIAIGGADSGLSLFGGTPINTCEIYDPVAGTWTTTGNLNYARQGHAATLMFNGMILVTGGIVQMPAELYDPSSGIWTVIATPTNAYFQHTSTLLPDGMVLLAKAGMSELYNPCTEEFIGTEVLSAGAGAFRGQAHLLQNDKVLYLGGAVGGGGTVNCFLYDHLTGTWDPTGNMNFPRTSFGSTILPSGEVVASAGYDGGLVATSEVYNPINGVWTAGPNVSTARSRVQSVLLPNGEVILPGGANFAAILNSTEVLDPGMGNLTLDRPVITSITPSTIIVPASTAGYISITVNGTGFQDNNNRFGGEASCGGTRNSATNYPIIQVSRIGVNRNDNDFTTYLPFDIDPGNSWDSTSTIFRFPYGVPNQLPPGVYTVKVIANGIPSEPAYLNVSVDCNVVADYTADVVCIGDSTTFTDQSTGTPGSCWMWIFGDGDSSFVQHPKHLYTTAGTYNAKLIVHSVMGCVDSIIKTVTVLGPSIANVTATGCDSALINGNWYFSSQIINDTLFAGTSNGCDSIVNTDLTMLNSVVTNLNQTNCDSALINGNWYFSSQIVTDLFTAAAANGCDSTVITDLTINNSVSGIVAVSICEGDDFTFVDGTLHTNILVDESYTSTFTTSLGCDSLIITNITIMLNPIVDAGVGQTVCDGSTATLNGAGALTYVWDNGVTDDVSFSPLATTLYTVTGTDANGCIGTDVVTITMSPLPLVVFTADSLMGCEPFTVTFTNSSALIGDNCAWEFGNGMTAVGCQNVTTTYSYAGLYSVSLTVTSLDGCVTTETYTDYIAVFDQPIAIFNMDQETVELDDMEVEFTNSSLDATNYTWIWSDGSANSFVEHPTHEFIEFATSAYTVEMIAANGICSDTTSAIIPLIEPLIFYIPNVFTPDGNEINNTFFPVFTSGFDPYNFHLMLFNRWGELLFESYNAAVGWDGTYANGDLVQDGTYIWKINFGEKSSDKKHTFDGHVTVLK